MLLANPLTLLLALVLAGPALWHAFVLEDLDIATALVRYLIAVFVSGLMLSAVRRVTAPYLKDESEEAGETVTTLSVDRVPTAARRATDPASPEPASDIAELEPTQIQSPRAEIAALPPAGGAR
ncbi:hypothetical protein GCM10010156_51270 [Planobispora rosea]|uniref:Uncharacterized protein n=1 Tax=Planobispora rosea TaxID=35762 RepID=A0A8J3S6W6_PLARO|nr:hypothetical protein [Planobispora rosea]GGS86482.1 hypothetical protein GCM10010156_51270 [Planobispora rosea]GIH89047.1 hypothetical protein Pro02_74550 [Planobispora rosea]